jgi:hypothetical protein
MPRVMSEAAFARIEYAFGTLNLRQIEADIDPRDVASARLLERLGFVREGYCAIAGIVEVAVRAARKGRSGGDGYWLSLGCELDAVP